MLSWRSSWMVCGLALLCSGSALAQGLEFGVKGGVNIADVKIAGEDPSPSLDPRFGGLFGAFVTLPLTSWIELQPEGLYAMKGARLNDRGVKSTLALDYVEIPVLARVTKRGSGTTHYYVAGGPSFGLRVRARSRVDFGTSTEEIDVSDELERFDLGIAVGGGVEFGRIVIDGRYTFGLKDIDKDKTDTVTVKNRVISITAGLRF